MYWLVPKVEWLDLEGAVKEFGELMEDQLYLRKEADNLVFPSPLKALCSRDVLVETWQEGRHIQVKCTRKKNLFNLSGKYYFKKISTSVLGLLV